MQDYNQNRNGRSQRNILASRWWQATKSSGKDEAVDSLEKQLLRLGNIGSSCRRPGWRFIVGNCAEQHAANIFMKQCKENKLANLYFSKAMRPRTKQIFPYCDNCKDTFPNL